MDTTPSPPRPGGLAPRVKLALFVWPFILALLFFAPPWAFAILVVVSIWLAAREFVSLALPAASNGERQVAAWAAALVAIPVFIKGTPPARALDAIPMFALAVVTAAGLLQLVRAPEPMRHRKHVILLLTVAYCGILPIHGALLKAAGNFWILLAIVITWGGSIAGYFVGRRPGHHPMAEHISPQKTYEGAVIIAFTAVLLSYGLNLLFDSPLSYAAVFILAFVGSALSQAGDLLESALKRSAGVKDSSSLMGTQGGALDAIDGIIWVAPWVYYAGALIS